MPSAYNDAAAPTSLIAVGGSDGVTGTAFSSCISGNIAYVEIFDVAPSAVGGAAYYANQIQAIGYGLIFNGTAW